MQVFWRDPVPKRRRLLREEANAFAADLLVPRYMLHRCYPRLSATDLSKLFAVSMPVITNGAFEYGL